MGITASEVITLAQDTKALSKEQLARILELAPTMGEAELENLKNKILKVRDEEMKRMKKSLEVYQKAASAHKEWESDKARTQLNVQEGAVQREDLAQAENLITTI